MSSENALLIDINPAKCETSTGEEEEIGNFFNENMIPLIDIQNESFVNNPFDQVFKESQILTDPIEAVAYISEHYKKPTPKSVTVVRTEKLINFDDSVQLTKCDKGRKITSKTFNTFGRDSFPQENSELQIKLDNKFTRILEECSDQSFNISAFDLSGFDLGEDIKNELDTSLIIVESKEKEKKKKLPILKEHDKTENVQKNREETVQQKVTVNFEKIKKQLQQIIQNKRLNDLHEKSEMDSTDVVPCGPNRSTLSFDDGAKHNKMENEKNNEIETITQKTTVNVEKLKKRMQQIVKNDFERSKKSITEAGFSVSGQSCASNSNRFLNNIATPIKNRNSPSVISTPLTPSYEGNISGLIQKLKYAIMADSSSRSDLSNETNNNNTYIILLQTPLSNSSSPDKNDKSSSLTKASSLPSIEFKERRKSFSENLKRITPPLTRSNSVSSKDRNSNATQAPIKSSKTISANEKHIRIEKDLIKTKHFTSNGIRLKKDRSSFKLPVDGPVKAKPLQTFEIKKTLPLAEKENTSGKHSLESKQKKNLPGTEISLQRTEAHPHSSVFGRRTTLANGKTSTGINKIDSQNKNDKRQSPLLNDKILKNVKSSRIPCSPLSKKCMVPINPGGLHEKENLQPIQSMKSKNLTSFKAKLSSRSNSYSNLSGNKVDQKAGHFNK